MSRPLESLSSTAQWVSLPSRRRLRALLSIPHLVPFYTHNGHLDLVNTFALLGDKFAEYVGARLQLGSRLCLTGRSNGAETAELPLKYIANWILGTIVPIFSIVPMPVTQR